MTIFSQLIVMCNLCHKLVLNKSKWLIDKYYWDMWSLWHDIISLYSGTCWESGNRNADPPGRGSLWPSQTRASLSVPSLCPVAEDIIATTTQKATISSLSYIIIQYQYNYIIHCKTGFSNNLGLKKWNLLILLQKGNKKDIK